MKVRFIVPTRELKRHYDKKTRQTNLQIVNHPPGRIIEGPMSYKHCLLGRAVPEDEEAKSRVKMTEQEIRVAYGAYQKIEAGIDQEDSEAYDRGLMVGYKPDGEEGDTWKPGPNWSEGCEEEYYSELEETEDDD